jgi:uncharacterized protein
MSQITQVSFQGPLGTLRGILHYPDRTPAPAVLLLHGFTGYHIEDGKLFVHAARHLAQAGFAVLRFDFFGSGDSDGEFDQFTILTEVADAVAGIDWLGTQPGIDASRIGVVGLSMGGGVTGLLAGQDPRVKAAVFWNAVGNSAVMADIPDHQDETMGPLRVGPDFGPAARQADISGTLRKYAGPGLVVHGTNDGVVPASHAELLLAALGTRGELCEIEGADHTFRSPDWQRAAITRTADWLSKQLKP